MLKTLLAIILTFLSYATSFADVLPKGFVYLQDVAPSIRQDMRYAGYHNFVGRPVKGYVANKCILTKKAALALAKVQAELEKSSLALQVYDCYRPQIAVDDFVAWSKTPNDQLMKTEFYPRVDKSKTFKLGYIASHSGHTRGSTVDLTIVPGRIFQQASFSPVQPLIACYAPYQGRFRDNSIDMGTGFDCLDEYANIKNQNVGIVPQVNRTLLRRLMIANGFKPYDKEWWHFTLRNEPYPKTYFNFPVA